MTIAMPWKHRRTDSFCRRGAGTSTWTFARYSVMQDARQLQGWRWSVCRALATGTRQGRPVKLVRKTTSSRTAPVWRAARRNAVWASTGESVGRARMRPARGVQPSLCTPRTRHRGSRGTRTTAHGHAMSGTGGRANLARHARRRDALLASTVGRVARNRMQDVWLATRASFLSTATLSAARTCTRVHGHVIWGLFYLWRQPVFHRLRLHRHQAVP